MQAASSRPAQEFVAIRSEVEVPMDAARYSSIQICASACCELMRLADSREIGLDSPRGNVMKLRTGYPNPAKMSDRLIN